MLVLKYRERGKAKMGEEYGTSLRTTTRDAAKVHGNEDANTIYGAEPRKKNLLDDNQKVREEFLPERTALFGLMIGVDKYG